MVLVMWLHTARDDPKPAGVAGELQFRAAAPRGSDKSRRREASWRLMG